MPGFENGNRTARNKPEQGVAPLRAASGARVNADVGRTIMTEKIKTLISGGIMLAAQGVVAWAVWISSWCMSHNWSEVLGAVALPWPTDLALRYGAAIPIATAIFTVIAVVIAMRRNRAASAGLLSAAVLEIIALSIFTFAIAMPALTITYRLGP